MTDKQPMLEKLEEFKQRDKFSTSAWNERGLNPSDSEMCSRLESLFNSCTDNLIFSINENHDPKRLKKLLKNGLKDFNSFDYDTEEREFICDYFFQLSQIVKVDFKNNLNNWLYGRVLNSFFKITSLFKGQDRIIETFSQECIDCGSKLETYVLKKENGIPDYSWTIIQCNNCKGYNMLSIGPNIKQLKYGEFKLVEQLPKVEYTAEQAKLRLEQIRFFR